MTDKVVDKAKVEAIAREIQALSPADRLRVAVGFLENQQPDLALTLVRRVAEELGAALALRDLEQRKDPRT